MRGFDQTQRLAQTMVKKQRANKKLNQNGPVFLRGRFLFFVFLLALLPISIVVRAAYIQVFNADFLKGEGDLRIVKLSQLPAFRGTLTDRNAEELAISIPSKTIWIDPVQLFNQSKDTLSLFSSPGWKQLAQLVGDKPEKLSLWLQDRSNKRFVYLKRNISQYQSKIVRALHIPGVHLLSESRRFYPTGEVAAHVLGFTNIDGKGLEGIERAFDKVLQGQNGKAMVQKDLLGNVIDKRNIIKAPLNGQNINLSIDARIQTIAYVELKKMVEKVHASAGTAVVLDVNSGEVLAMVNQPSYNPNNRQHLDVASIRNRAVTDSFEPGSTLKPFTALAALASGKFRSNSMIDTRPLKVNGYWVGKDHNYGMLSVSDIIKKSSNVGVTKMALALPTDQFLKIFYQLGFGQDTGSGFPGENTGLFKDKIHWSDIDKATLSYGYGISVTALQLARAYSVLGSGGIIRPVTFLKQNHTVVGRRIISQKYTLAVLKMMEHVLDDGGTGTRARVQGYRVAGKTGTSRKAKSGGYSDKYVAVFAGVAPISNPKLAVVVMVDDPKGDEYYGGEVSAPVFSAIMESSLRWLDIAPDQKTQTLVSSQAHPSAKGVLR